MNRRQLGFLWLAMSLLGAAQPARAGIEQRAGNYRVTLVTEPAIVPVGEARLRMRLADSRGQAVEGAIVRVIAQMPGMPMGEREDGAEMQSPGVYVAPARFSMAGAYTVTIRVTGEAGAATANIPLSTGQNTGTLDVSSSSLLPLFGWLLFLGVIAFTLYRMRRTGQRVHLRWARDWRVLAGLAMLVATYALARAAVTKFQKPGHVSVIDAQAMDMSQMKPPVGAVPVAAMAAKRQRIEATVHYTGSAVSFVDQDVSPRVTGWITWMPFYPGQRVHRGELVARLDAAELSSKVREQSAAETMAEHDSELAQMQYHQSLGNRAQAQAQVAAARGALADARGGERKAKAAVQEASSDVAAARGEEAAANQEVEAAAEDRANAQADLEGAQSQIADAQAQLSAAKADQTYADTELRRAEKLFESGVVSQASVQKDRAEAQNAEAKVRQAQARIDSMNAAVRGAQSRIRRSEAMIAAAKARAAQAEAKIGGSQARIEQAQAEAASAGARITQMQADVEAAQANSRALDAASGAAQHQIEHTQAGIRQAKAQLNTASVVKNYTELRANIDGIVTQRMIGPGVLVNPGQAILRISQISPIRLQANVAESDLRNVRSGSVVHVHSMKDPGREVRARVSSVFPAVDLAARTGIVEAVVPNLDGRFLPGEYLSMEIATGASESALVVPSRSLIWQPKASGVVTATQASPKVWVLTSGTLEQTAYTCTMHPDEKQDTPGKCPT
jgi:multidrug resistance efflux pump